jgi:endonuclease G
MEHKDYKNTDKDFIDKLAKNSACSIDELEERTGLDFFCNLRDDDENIIESSFNASSWGL